MGRLGHNNALLQSLWVGVCVWLEDGWSEDTEHELRNTSSSDIMTGRSKRYIRSTEQAQRMPFIFWMAENVRHIKHRTMHTADVSTLLFTLWRFYSLVGLLALGEWVPDCSIEIPLWWLLQTQCLRMDQNSHPHLPHLRDAVSPKKMFNMCQWGTVP